MVKLSIFVQRRADLSHEQFADYWMNVHWPLVRSVPEVRQYTRRYVQLHPIQVPEGLPSHLTTGSAKPGSTVRTTS
jgi:EthD domain